MLSFSLKEIAKIVSGEIQGDASLRVDHLASIDLASDGALTFYAQGMPKQALEKTRATAVLVDASKVALCPTHAIVVACPRLACAQMANHMRVPVRAQARVHSAAVLSPESRVHPSCDVGPNVVVGAGSTLDEGVMVASGAVIGKNVTIGPHAEIHENVVICDGVKVGSHAILYPGCVIGSEGFGHVPHGEDWVKVHHLYAVVLGDYVEIGANTTVDRGYLRDTVIENAVKIDNQVQIGHNVLIGEKTLIAGCVGIAGSAEIGANCLIGGGCRINGHIRIVDRVVLAADTTVLSSVTTPGVYSSCAVLQTHREWRKTAALLKKLPQLFKLNKMNKVEASE